MVHGFCICISQQDKYECILTTVSALTGSASDSNPGAAVFVGVDVVLHSRIVIFSYMNFLDEVLQQ